MGMASSESGKIFVAFSVVDLVACSFRFFVIIKKSTQQLQARITAPIDVIITNKNVASTFDAAAVERVSTFIVPSELGDFVIVVAPAASVAPVAPAVVVVVIVFTFPLTKTLPLRTCMYTIYSTFRNPLPP